MEMALWEDVGLLPALAQSPSLQTSGVKTTPTLVDALSLTLIKFETGSQIYMMHQVY
jgi:hypothetical protein